MPVLRTLLVRRRFFRELLLIFRNRGKQTLDEIAIAHDYLTQKGGAERVVLAMHKAFPEATIYTTLYDPESTYPEFKNAKIVVSPLNKIPFFRKNHRLALPLLPLASQTLQVPAVKTLVSSTGWAHGFAFAGKSLIYCHSPARWVYLSDQYLGDNSSPLVARALKLLVPALRLWDQQASKHAGPYLANSSIIKKRIWDVYTKESDILFPPFSPIRAQELAPIPGLEDFMADGDYFLLVSRLLPYKNIDKAVAAFRDSSQKLLVIGAGPMEETLKAMAGPNVRFASNIADSELRYAYAHCRALLAVSYEDFGLTPLEAGAWGKPTIALKAGGYLDTIREGLNGTYIQEPTPELISEAVKNFDPATWDRQAIQAYVEDFSEERFIRQLQQRIASL